MKAHTIALTAGLAALSLAMTPAADPETWNIIPEASTAKWKGEKVTGEHSGTVGIKSGFVQVKNDELVGGTFVVDMTSIKVTDLEGKSAEKLEGHLRSADFFDTEGHPTSALTIKKVANRKKDEPYNKTITADLEIKGITEEIVFPAQVEVMEGKLIAIGEMTVDRTKYDVRYGSSSFFDGLGDRAIDDEFTIHVSIGAKK